MTEGSVVGRGASAEHHLGHPPSPAHNDTRRDPRRDAVAGPAVARHVRVHVVGEFGPRRGALERPDQRAAMKRLAVAFAKDQRSLASRFIAVSIAIASCVSGTSRVTPPLAGCVRDRVGPQLPSRALSPFELRDPCGPRLWLGSDPPALPVRARRLPGSQADGHGRHRQRPPGLGCVPIDHCTDEKLVAAFRR